MAQTYPPLCIAETIDKNGSGYDRINRIFKLSEDADAEPICANHDEAIWFFTNYDFMHNPPHKLVELRGYRLGMWEKYLILNCYEIFKMCGYSPAFIESESFSPSAEIKDIFLSPILWEDWGKYKQVFKPDKYFADALLHTTKLQISKTMIKHLPCNVFYVDLSDCPQFGDIVGMLINVFDTDVDCRISIILVGRQLETFTFYATGSWNEQNLMEISADTISDEAAYSTTPESIFQIFGKEDEGFDVKELMSPVSRIEAHLFAMQMISYLSMDEPQLSESSLTKNTYRPRAEGAPIKNKWSEVKIDDVGIVYGKAFSKQLKEIQKQESETSEDDQKEHKHRKSPSPHFRSAHWHRFWVGKGRTECKVKWVEPMFIGAKQSKNVVIHTVS
jgi:hypothetical protein